MDFSPEFRRKQKEILAQYKNKDVVEIKPDHKPQNLLLAKLEPDVALEAWVDASSRRKVKWSDDNNIWFEDSERDVNDILENSDYDSGEED
jgi:hypothetical protein